MANCQICKAVLAANELNRKHDGDVHFACRKSKPVGVTESSAGPAWVFEPGSTTIAYRLVGKLSAWALSKADEKFLWQIAGGTHETQQPCGKRGNFSHDSSGASRLDKKGRTIMTVFYKAEEKYKIALYGFGEHVDAKGEAKASTYKVDWDDGSKTTFALGSATDVAKPEPKKNKEG